MSNSPENEKESNIDKIIKCLYDVEKPNQRKSKNRWIDTKPGWKNYKHNEEKERIINIDKFMKDISIQNSATEKPYKLYPLIKNETIDDGNTSPEKIIEKNIVKLYGNKNIFNQWRVGQPSESIDLICKNDNQIVLIELKAKCETWNTPCYALVEIIKDFCLLKKHNYADIAKINELCLLAPIDYYEKYFKTHKYHIENAEEFFNTIEFFNSNNIYNIKFTMKYINNNTDDLKINKTDSSLLWSNWLDNDISTREKLREKLGI